MALSDIKDYRQIDERIATSGSLTEAQITEIAQAGYEVVINLLPASDLRLPDEDITVEEANMEYVNIPVIWTAPQIAEVIDFFDVMDARLHRRVWVHCAANMRVSTFLYLWRTLRRSVPEDVARADLNAIWVPNLIWQKFLRDVQAVS